MADLYESRCVSATFSGSEHVVRAACFGDSMMYGQGVLPRHTLPAHLTRLLNAAWLDSLVWVDNFGESSGNLWHAWSRLKSSLRHKNFDVLIFSVCNNDSQIFESNTVPYSGEQYLQHWQPGSFSYRMIERLVVDLRDTCKAQGMLPLIIYNSFHDRDWPITEILQKLLTAAELPFVNMLQYYPQQTTLATQSYIASEFDGHPSGLAHELAARRVVGELTRVKPPGKAGGFAQDPADKLRLALTDLVEQGVSIDQTLDWAREAMVAKAAAARRQLRGDGERLAADCAALARELEQCRTDWGFTRRLEAAMRLSPPPRQHAEALAQMFSHGRNSDEMVYLLEQAANVGEIEQLSRLFPVGGYHDQLDRLAFFTGDAQDEISQTKARLAPLQVTRAARLRASPAALVSDSPAFRRDADLRAIPGWDFAAVCDDVERLADHLERLEPVARRWGVPNAAARRIWAIAFAGIRNSLYYLDEVDRSLIERLALDGPVGRPWTRIDVMLEGSPSVVPGGTICALQVEAEYLVPDRQRVREMHWAGVEKERAVYRFEIPLLLLGNIRVGVGDSEPTRQRFLDGTTRITRIDIYQLSADEEPADAAAARSGVTWSEPDSRLPAISFPGLLLP